MSLTTRIFILAKKCSAISFTPSLHVHVKSDQKSTAQNTSHALTVPTHLSIDFWMRRTLQPDFLIFLQMLRRYCLSSLRILSIWE